MKKKKVTVLQVRNSVVFGGVETTMLGWLDNIDRDRFYCPVALFSNNGASEEAFRGPLSRCHDIFKLPWAPNRRFFKAVDELVRLIEKLDVKLLHTHDWRSDVVGYFAAKKAGIPIVTTIYVWFRRPLKILINEVIDAWIIRRFDCVTAVCEATRKQTVARGVEDGKTEVLISGISGSRDPGTIDRDGVRARFGFGADDICLVFTARFYPEKAHLALLESLRIALSNEPRLKLLLLGIGPLEESIKRKATELGLSDNVVIPGFVEDVTTVLKAMDVMVHASLAEGISLAIYEGMLVGLPVIGTDVDGTPEVVIPGKTGWLVPVKDRDALAAAILEAAARPDLLALYGKNARELITGKYNMDRARQSLESVYHRILNTRG